MQANFNSNTQKTTETSSSSSSSSSESLSESPPGCFRRTFLGVTACKAYLSVACIIGSIFLGWSLFTPRGNQVKKALFILSITFAIYVFTQIIGLVAVFTRYKWILIPYEVLMVFLLGMNVWALVTPVYAMFIPCTEYMYKCQTLGFDTAPLAAISFFFICFNCLCMFTVVNIHLDPNEMRRETMKEEMKREQKIDKLIAEMRVPGYHAGPESPVSPASQQSTRSHRK